MSALTLGPAAPGAQAPPQWRTFAFHASAVPRVTGRARAAPGGMAHDASSPG